MYTGQPGNELPTDVTYDDFVAEYAKSGKSSCRCCGDKIEKVDLSIFYCACRLIQVYNTNKRSNSFLNLFLYL